MPALNQEQILRWPRYRLSEQAYAAAGGGFPIFIKETGCVGAVVVSGLPQLEDHRLVIEAIREPISRLNRIASPKDRRSCSPASRPPLFTAV